MDTVFDTMRRYSPHGPLINSELYTAVMTTPWGGNVTYTDTSVILSAMVKTLSMNASFNFYMFSGGTNFGFKNGKYCCIIRKILRKI